MGDTLKGIILQQEGDNRKKQKCGFPKWTSVADALPKKSGKYLAVKPSYIGGYVHDILYYNAITKQFSRYDPEYGTILIEALYWMPLPDMPKECER